MSYSHTQAKSQSLKYLNFSICEMEVGATLPSFSIDLFFKLDTEFSMDTTHSFEDKVAKTASLSP